MSLTETTFELSFLEISDKVAFGYISPRRWSGCGLFDIDNGRLFP